MRISTWRWVHVLVAALAMVATLPGRTHGLGLITEPLLGDLHLDRQVYAAINLWATLLGALFCLPCGWLIDRLGLRVVLAGVSAALGAVVLVMSCLPADGLTVPALFVLILLTRGFGQSALSVASLALIGKTAGRRAGPAVGVYSVATALGFMGAFGMVALADKTLHPEWRALWAGIGVGVLGFSLTALLVRPAALTLEESTAERAAYGATLGQALATPAFWVFAVTVSLYGLVAAGMSLFNESILKERNFDRSVFLQITAVMPMIGLASNLTTGWLATRWSMPRLLAVSMLVLAGALLAFPFVNSYAEVYAYAGAMGVAGGMVTVLFFAVWGPGFGPRHLGKIQGAAQMLTVLASAAGPLLLAKSKEHTGSYVPLFQWVAVAAALLGAAAWFTPMPRPQEEPRIDFPPDIDERAPVLRPASDHVLLPASEQIQRDTV
jgi:MFS family permease